MTRATSVTAMPSMTVASSPGSPLSAPCRQSRPLAVFNTNGSVTNLGMISDSSNGATAYGINDDGYVVGDSGELRLAVDGQRHASVRTTASGASTAAVVRRRAGIDSANDVVGRSDRVRLYLPAGRRDARPELAGG